MTTAQAIIRQAFRESQILDLNVPPTDDEQAEALTLLQGVVSRRIRPPVLTCWLGAVSSIKQQRGVVLRDFTSFVPHTALPQDVYLNCIMDNTYSVLLPPSPSDGSRLIVIDVGKNFGTFPLTLVGNGNLVDDGVSITLSTSGVGVNLLYRRDLGQWITVTDLGLSQNIPFPTEFDTLFSIDLALRLNPRYGVSMDEITAQIYQDVKSRFNSRYMSDNSSANPDILWDSYTGWNGNRGTVF